MENITNFIKNSIIDESKEDIQRFKITDLKKELEINRVSKSRISEIIKFFTTVLGEGPYYCVSGDNIEGKNTVNVTSVGGGGNSITDIIDLSNLPEEFDTDEDLKNLKKKWAKHNEEIKSFTQDKIDHILDLEKNLTLSIKPFRYGKHSSSNKNMHLNAAIGKYDGEYIPVIMQTEYSKHYSWDAISKGLDTTLYVACKNID